jgi:CubicO group peptidase (beta-lactamase class C family)
MTRETTTKSDPCRRPDGIAVPLRVVALVGLALATLPLLASCGSRTAPSSASGTPGWPGETWPVSTPEAENVNGAVLDSIDAEIQAGEFGRIDHFLVIRHGKLIFDRHYDRDYAALAAADGRDTTHDVYNYDDPRWHPYYEGTDLHTLQSVTKSITSLALGIAVDEGHVAGTDVPAMSFFEAYAPDLSDPRRQEMTLADLLTMRSGIDWNEQIPYDDPENTCLQLEASDDWIRFVLDRPMREAPGTRFDYNSGVSVLIGKIVGVATGTRVDRWAAERLFAPLGIRDWHWKTTPDGEVDTEGGLYLEPHDLARIAYLVLRNGRWGDRQVVSEAWIRKSVRPRVQFPGPDGESSTRGYGYQWWLQHENGKPVVIAGSGYGGQFPVVVPRKDLVVVFNAWNIHDRPLRNAAEAIMTRIAPAAHETNATTQSDLTDFATRYAAAWSGQKPEDLASFYVEGGSLVVNDGPPSVGRAAIAATAGAFMQAFPDMIVRMDSVIRTDGGAIFHWTWTGTNAGSGGTGRAVRISGYERWTLAADGLIAESRGHYDEAEYERQMSGDGGGD